MNYQEEKENRRENGRAACDGFVMVRVIFYAR